MKPPLVLAAAALAGVVAAGAASDADDPFAFLAPTVRVSHTERAHLDADGVVARVLPAHDGYIAFFAAARLNARPEALLEWTREIEALKRGPLVLAVGRFSDPVADADLDGLTLDSDEIDDLKRCRVGSCEIKLSAGEITDLQNALRVAGPGWRDAAQRQFRKILIARVRLHRERGLLAFPQYADHGTGISVGEAFSAMAARSPYLTSAFPDLINALVNPVHTPVPARDAFYYWSRERYGTGKTVVTITYVRLRTDRSIPQALSVSTQLYASHYIDGALGVTAVVCGESGTSCYLAYLNHTRVDLLGGIFGGIKRAVIEGRIESDGPQLMRGVTRKLEGGPPVAHGGAS
jgi:hypothetical protein